MSYIVPVDNPFDLPSFGFISVGTGITITSPNQEGKIEEIAKYSCLSSMYLATYIHDNHTKYLLAATSAITAINAVNPSVGSYRYDGENAYYAHPNTWSAWMDASPTAPNPLSYVGTENLHKAAWQMVYGENEVGSIIIPVQWMRSDGILLEDTFTIEIGEGEETPTETNHDEWAGSADVSWNGHHYNINRSVVPTIHYANGYLWQDGISTEYTVEQAASMGWLILIQ